MPDICVDCSHNRLSERSNSTKITLHIYYNYSQIRIRVYEIFIKREGKDHPHADTKLSLCLMKNYAIKTYGGSGGTDPQILTSALDGDKW
jgi:hypothetical protein